MYSYVKNISQFNNQAFIPQVWGTEVDKIVLSTNRKGISVKNGQVTTSFEEVPTNDELAMLDSLATSIVWVFGKPIELITPEGLKVSFSINSDGIPIIAGKTMMVNGENVKGGEVIFDNEKTKDVVFEKAFSKKPFIDLTMGDSISQPPYRINISKTGFTIKTQVNFTGNITWKATLL